VSRLGRAAAGWAGRNEWLEQRVRSRGFVRKDLRRIWPGESIDEALEAAIDLHVLGIRTLYEWLPAPGPADGATAAAVAAEHLELLERLRAAEIDGELSVSPAQLGLGADEDACFARLLELAAAAEAQGSWLWLETGPGATVDGCLELYQRLRASHASVGVCLSASLRRSARDVERLLPIGPAIRLVKGSTDAPHDAALDDDAEVDASFMALAVTLLRESRTRPMRLALATHDVDLVDQIASHAAAAGVAKDGFQIQMRYGVRVRDQRRLARAGYTVQTLIAYGPGWYPWYVGLLRDRPSNALVALRQALPG
jgi:proline dehydrogenase